MPGGTCPTTTGGRYPVHITLDIATTSTTGPRTRGTPSMVAIVYQESSRINGTTAQRWHTIRSVWLLYPQIAIWHHIGITVIALPPKGVHRLPVGKVVGRHMQVWS